MKTFEQFVNEANSGDKIYIHQNTLWVSYSPSSGSTYQIKGNPDEWRGYVTNDPKHDNYSSIADDIVKWAKSEKPAFKVKDYVGYKIPCYWQKGSENDLSVWGGDIKPDYYLYLSVYMNDPTIVSLFKTKKEMLAFIGD